MPLMREPRIEIKIDPKELRSRMTDGELIARSIRELSSQLHRIAVIDALNRASERVPEYDYDSKLHDELERRVKERGT